MTINQNLIPEEPSLKDLLDLYRKDILLNLNCHHIGTVQTFNPLNQTATATINYKKTFFNFDSATQTYVPQLVDYPILIDVPVIALGGGDGALTFPISGGDECLVLFNDRDLDNWFAGGGSGGAVATPRLHSFSDGLILVGIRSLANVIPNYNGSATELRTRDGLTKIIVSQDSVKVVVGPGMVLEVDSTGKFKVLNVGGVDLIAAVVQLFNDVATGETAAGPLVMPTFAADIAILETYQP